MKLERYWLAQAKGSSEWRLFETDPDDPYGCTAKLLHHWGGGFGVGLALPRSIMIVSTMLGREVYCKYENQGVAKIWHFYTEEEASEKEGDTRRDSSRGAARIETTKEGGRQGDDARRTSARGRQAFGGIADFA